MSPRILDSPTFLKSLKTWFLLETSWNAELDFILFSCYSQHQTVARYVKSYSSNAI